MPYIIRELREVLEKQGTCLENPGDLNYLLTKVCLRYLNYKGERYQVYNDIIGALECCKLEMYRRAIAPYEDVKIKENGDVYE
jgi:hypothetical protein